MTNITRHELQALIATGDVIVVDTLGPQYYEAAHLPGAINIPHTEVARLAPELLPDKAAPIVTYCSNTACQNSHAAAAQLRSLGYTDVRRYDGGPPGLGGGRPPARAWRARSGVTLTCACRGARRDATMPCPLPLSSPGGVPEWLNGAVSKTVVGVTPLPRVRISPPPLTTAQTAVVQGVFTLPRCCGRRARSPLEAAQDRSNRSPTVPKLSQRVRAISIGGWGVWPSSD